MLGFPGGASGKDPACQRRRPKRLGFHPWVEKIPWRRGMAYTLLSTYIVTFPLQCSFIKKQKLLNCSQCFHSWHSKPIFHDKVKVIFPKLKSHHCILLFQTLLQCLYMTLIIYLSSLPEPTKFHLISPLTISFIPRSLPVSIALTFCFYR